MNNKIKKVIFIVVLLGIITLIYFSYVRDWIRPVKVDVSAMENITYFNNKKSADHQSVLTKIHKQAHDNAGVTEPYDELAEYYYSNPEHIYERAVWFQIVEPSFLEISYTFNRANQSGNFSRDFVNVKIFQSPEYKFNYFTGPKLRLSYFGRGNQTLHGELSKNYGKFRPIFNLLSKHGKKDGFAYYISPLIYLKNEYGVVYNREKSTAFMVFVFEEYAITIDFPVIPPNDVEVLIPIVLNDIETLLKQTENKSAE